MKQIHVLVEGLTEELFVREVLSEYFYNRDLFLIVSQTKKGKSPQGSFYRGGVLSYGQVKHDLTRFLHNTGVICVTSMIDYFGLAGRDFPGMNNLKGSCYDKVKQLEKAVEADINHKQFKAYFSLHEFEALVLSEPEILVRGSAQDERKHEGIIQEFKDILKNLSSPEELNLTKPPSYRIIELIPGYKKNIDGISAAKQIGIDKLRSTCPHFNEWVTFLESLED